MCDRTEPCDRKRPRAGRSASPGELLLAGDLAYMQGSLQNFRDCFEPSWGKFRRSLASGARQSRIRDARRLGLSSVLRRCGRTSWSDVLRVSHRRLAGPDDRLERSTRTAARRNMNSCARALERDARALHDGRLAPSACSRPVRTANRRSCATCGGCSTTTTPTWSSPDTIICTSASASRTSTAGPMRAGCASSSSAPVARSLRLSSGRNRIHRRAVKAHGVLRLTLRAGRLPVGVPRHGTGAVRDSGADGCH